MPTVERIAEFIAKWSAGGPGFALNEEQGAQQHFIELCAVLSVAAPTGGDDYVFEKGMLALGQRRGYADVFKRGCFAWENKAPGRSLDTALRQLMTYALALDNPPLLVVSDRLRIEVHTHFNGTPSECHVVRIEELTDPAKRELLRRCFEAPESFRPARTNRQITEVAAHAFAETAYRMREAGIPAARVSHFLTQCLFCFFSEDVGLLPGRLFERLVTNPNSEPATLRTGLAGLFTTMHDGGLFGADSVPWFNGGLFASIDVPELSVLDVAALRDAAAMDWSAIDPSIFGTLFERGLDPAKRAQLGAHYTDPATIMRLVEPVVARPLKAEWESIKLTIANHLARHKKQNDAEYRKARAAFVGFLERLREFRVLDPACGSGNFLYLALKTLKDIEHQANLEAESLGLHREVDAYTSPANVLGLELNEFAAELARVTVWIGELQWRLLHGYPFKTRPVLERLEHIECRDALLNTAGTEAQWPRADAIVGNPPFLGVGRKRRELGDVYVEMLDRVFAPRVPGAADLVCYWFDKALTEIRDRGTKAAGLVATNSIRGGANRRVLENIGRDSRIFEAWSDEPWVNEGAAVRVSLICFGGVDGFRLDARPVSEIYSDLTAPTSSGQALDLSRALRLAENANASFQGASKKGKFEINGQTARSWLDLPNPNGRPNSNVLKPWANGFELSRRPQEQWIIDFGTSMTEAEASLYEAPFRHVLHEARPERLKNNREAYRRFWWRFAEPRPGLRSVLRTLPRYAATIAHSKHRFFVWLPNAVSPDQALITVARADDATFGVLHSRLHELWSLRMGSSLEDRPRYTPTSCFETFPFPDGLAPIDTADQKTEVTAEGAQVPAGIGKDAAIHAEAIARSSKRLVDLRDRWLNPPEWTERVPEVVPLGLAKSPFPDRIVPRLGHEKDLAKRTLTNLYNERPAWLAQAHEALDAAVAAAYGWTDYSAEMPDEEILRRLLALNHERAAAERAGQ
ncbi:MAG: type IIL restriction-modification enzyme MmeI [Burkholderiaceae bacterium]|nr:type IIL restriction-modification enzyme MmeI [Burkholderiaceae bacterium]